MNGPINVLLMVLGGICVLGLVAVMVIVVEMFTSEHRREASLQHDR